jgi:hypothetical protein
VKNSDGLEKFSGKNLKSIKFFGQYLLLADFNPITGRPQQAENDGLGENFDSRRTCGCMKNWKIFQSPEGLVAV